MIIYILLKGTSNNFWPYI